MDFGFDHDHDHRFERGHHHRQPEATRFVQTNLVSDGSAEAGPALHTDPNLINPWGVSHPPGGPFWVSDNGTGVTTIYNGDGTAVPVAGNLAITIAPPAGQVGPSTPTGQVFNTSGRGFDISANGMTAPSVFIFATEDGTISGFNPAVNPSSSVLEVDNSAGGSGAVYKGLALAQKGGQELLYAANFHAGTVDVFNQSFQQINSFTDPNLPAGFAPFNVQVLHNHLFVTFALQDADKHDDVAGAGNGFVDEFNLNGHLMHRVASGGPLNSPWGLAIAPPNFGAFSNDLLVGNFGDGTINAYDPRTDRFMGQVMGPDGFPLKIGDLWDLIPGTNVPGANPNAIYFTAGVQDEAHGLFGTLAAMTEPHRDGGFPGMQHHHHGMG